MARHAVALNKMANVDYEKLERGMLTIAKVRK